MLENFCFAKFKFKIKPIEKINLPSYSGSTLRGGFGYSFRKVTCIIKNKECFDCLLREKCIYSYVFETPISSNAKIMKKYTSAPHPFVIEPPLPKNVAPDTSFANDLEFGLVLIGKAIDYLPYFIYTFDELGKTGMGRGREKFILSEVRCNETNKSIYNADEKKLISDFKITTFQDLADKLLPFYNCKNIKVNFITPLRVKFGEKITSKIEFHILIRNLLRRISLLSYFHCGEELNINFKELCNTAQKIKIKDQNLRWYDLERYSSRQKTRVKMGGVIGEVEYEGNIKEFLPYLILGEYIHLGKNCTFGLGKYELERRGEDV